MVLSNIYGSVTSNEFDLGINNNRVIYMQPTTQGRRLGAAATLSVTAYGAAPILINGTLEERRSPARPIRPTR